MKHHTRYNNKYYADQEAYQITESYVFDAASGLYKPKTYNSQQQPSTHVQYEAPIDVKTRRDWLSILISALTLAFLIVYTDYTRSIFRSSQISAIGAVEGAWAGRDAANVAKNSLDSIEKRFRLEQRPYLSPDPRGIFVTPSGGYELTKNTTTDNFGVCVTFLNPGKSPAVEVITSDTEYRFGAKEQVESEVNSWAPKYNIPPSIVVPGGGLTAHCEPITIPDLQKWRDRTIEIFVLGAVTYRDLFEPKLMKPYETTYCWKIMPTGMPFSSCEPPVKFRTSIK